MEMKLFYTGAISGMTTEGTAQAEEFINGVNYVVLGTCGQETGVRLSALAHLHKQSLNELYFTTSLTTAKVKNLREDSHCEIFCTNGNDQVILGGEMEIVTDQAVKEAKWLPWMEEYYATSANPDYCILKFVPEYIRAMLM